MGPLSQLQQVVVDPEADQHHHWECQHLGNDVIDHIMSQPSPKPHYGWNDCPGHLDQLMCKRRMTSEEVISLSLCPKINWMLHQADA